MRIAGDHRLRIAAGAGQQRLHQAGQQIRGSVDLIAQPQPHIQRDLLIAAAAGMDFIGQSAHAILQLADHQRVNVFVGSFFVERWVLRIFRDCVECGDQLVPFFSRQDADAFERSRERLRAADVGSEQPAIEMERSGEALEDLRGTLSKAASPELHTDFFADFLSDARTWIGRPIRLMKPRASRWSYSAPMVKLAMSSEYSEFGDLRLTGWMPPL